MLCMMVVYGCKWILMAAEGCMLHIDMKLLIYIFIYRSATQAHTPAYAYGCLSLSFIRTWLYIYNGRSIWMLHLWMMDEAYMQTYQFREPCIHMDAWHEHTRIKRRSTESVDQLPICIKISTYAFHFCIKNHKSHQKRLRTMFAVDVV